jgi:hypothetical protein
MDRETYRGNYRDSGGMYDRSKILSSLPFITMIAGNHELGKDKLARTLAFVPSLPI